MHYDVSSAFKMTADMTTRRFVSAPRIASPLQTKRSAVITTKTSKMRPLNSVTPEYLKTLVTKSIRGNFDEQSHIMHEILLLHQDQIGKNHTLILSDLKNLFPMSRIFTIGSSRNRLGYPGDTVDIYIDKLRKDKELESSTLCNVRIKLEISKKFRDFQLGSKPTLATLRCRHEETDMWCEVNVSNLMCVSRTKLIGYYAKMNKRVAMLMMFVKFWAECYGLKAEGFSTYTLCLMVVFYLQHEPFFVPAVSELQTRDSCKIEGWNQAWTAFRKYSDNPFLKRANMYKLVVGFFKFYSRFDYASNVICPFIGRAVRKVDFLNLENMSSYYRTLRTKCEQDQKNFFDLTDGVCVQDPFQHSSNISLGIPRNVMGKFVALCKSASGLSRGSEQNLLERLLTKCQYCKSHSFEIVKKIRLQEAKWFNLVEKITNKTVKNVLQCEYFDISQHENFSGDENALAKFSYFCKGDCNVWKNRVGFHGGTEIDQEIVASTFAAQNSDSLTIEFVIVVMLKRKPCRVEIFVKGTPNCEDFFHLSHYLEVKLSRWMRIVEKEQQKLRKGLSSEDSTKIYVEPEPENLTTVVIWEEEEKEEKKLKLVDYETTDEEEEIPEDFFDDILKDFNLSDEVFEVNSTPELSSDDEVIELSDGSESSTTSTSLKRKSNWGEPSPNSKFLKLEPARNEVIDRCETTLRVLSGIPVLKNLTPKTLKEDNIAHKSPLKFQLAFITPPKEPLGIRDRFLDQLVNLLKKIGIEFVDENVEYRISSLLVEGLYSTCVNCKKEFIRVMNDEMGRVDAATQTEGKFLQGKAIDPNEFRL